jgi:diaminopimelate decarboxylase
MKNNYLGIWGLGSDENNELVIGGRNAVRLAGDYGTPLHVVNGQRLADTAVSFVGELKSAYPGKVSVHFAFKCNPVPGIIRIIKESGLNAEIMSGYELSAASKLGFSGNEIVVNGPFKTDELLNDCIAEKVRFINIDSLSELGRLNDLCNKYGHSADILLRVNPDFTPSGMNRGSSTGGRRSSPFGLDLKGGEVHRAVGLVKKMERVKFRGFHFHIGSGIQNTDDYRRALLKLKKIVEFTAASGLAVDVMDIGGGLGVPGSREMTTSEMLMYQAFGYLRPAIKQNENLSFGAFARSVVSGIYSIFGHNTLPELLFEPGRCITSPNQVLLLKIHQVKERKGLRKWLVADAGTGTLTMPLFYEYHEIVLCNDVTRRPSSRVTITGPGCFTADNVYRNKKMPEVLPGEIIAVMDSGAYFTSWESSFSFPRPAIIAVSDSGVKLIRERETFDDMVSLDRF